MGAGGGAASHLSTDISFPIVPRSYRYFRPVINTNVWFPSPICFWIFSLTCD